MRGSPFTLKTKTESNFLSLAVVLTMIKDTMFNIISNIFDTILSSQAIS